MFFFSLFSLSFSPSEYRNVFSCLFETIFAFCPFLKQNRGRQKTRTARSCRETPTQDSTGQSRNLHQLRLPEGNAEIRFCVEISIQRSIFFRTCYRVFLGKVSETKPILEQGLIVSDFQHVSMSIGNSCFLMTSKELLEKHTSWKLILIWV